MKKRLFATILWCVIACHSTFAGDIDPTAGLKPALMPVAAPSAYSTQYYVGFYPSDLVAGVSGIFTPTQQAQFQGLSTQMNSCLAAEKLFADGQGFLTAKLPAWRFTDPTLSPADLGVLKHQFNIWGDEMVSTYAYTSSNLWHLINLNVDGASIQIRPEIIGFKQALNAYCIANHLPYESSIDAPDESSLLFTDVLTAYQTFVSPANISGQTDVIGQAIYALHLAAWESSSAATAAGVTNAFTSDFGLQFGS